MAQITLGGQAVKKWYCIHCLWEGYNPDRTHEFPTCPECEWVCYDEDEAPGVANLYPILDKKLNNI